ncbi:ABC transporter substrate-binding protein [Candidatus Sumerlaeota bacterium]|nr:ABC transporter substrate-binding protein [Candidatus Sumerlaeota bacterium]
MNKRRKIVFLSVLCCFLILSIILFIGCGKQKEAPSDKRIVRYASWTATITELKLIKQLVKDFNEAHKDIEVKYEVIPGDYWSKIFTTYAGGRSYDVFWMDSTMSSGLINKGMLVDLSPLIKRDKINLDDFYPALLAPFKRGERIYGLPKDACPLALFWNKKVFREAGIQKPPDNWDEFVEIGKKITVDRDNDGRIDVWGFLPGNWYPLWAPFVWQWGGKFFEDTSVCFDEPSAIEGFKFFCELSTKHHIAPLRGEIGEIDVRKAFLMNKVGMFFGGWWDMADLDKYGKGRLEYGIAPLPKHKDTRITTGFTTSLVISNKSKDVEASWELIKFLTGKEGQLRRCSIGMAGPSRRSVAHSEMFKDKAREQTFIAGFDYCIVCTPPTPEVMTPLTEAVDYVMMGNKTPEQALKDAAKECRRILSELKSTSSRKQGNIDTGEKNEKEQKDQ